MDSYFALIGTHQHGIAVGSTNERTRVFLFLFRGECTQRSAMPRHPLFNMQTNTRPLNCTTPNYTLQFNMPQDACRSTPKVAGVATPYKST